MDIEVYKGKVIDLFKSNNATEEQWKAMAEAILWVAESNKVDIVKSIEKVVDPESYRQLFGESEMLL